MIQTDCIAAVFSKTTQTVQHKTTGDTAPSTDTYKPSIPVHQNLAAT